MARSTTLGNRNRRIGRVITHMANHLDEDLDLAALADVACFSPFHFHRIYRAAAGETVADTLRRLRLHRAATDLVNGQGVLSDISRRAGYGSVAAFTRAFKAFSGVPPAAFRDGVRSLPPTSPSLTRPSVHLSSEHRNMYDATKQEFPALRLAALPHRGDYNAIGPVFDRLYAWAGPRGLIGPATRSIGIYYDDPDAVPLAEMRSHACMTVGSDAEAPEGGEIITLPASRCATLLHVGPYAELHKAYRWLYGEWLPTSGEEPADRPCFEEYLNDPRDLPPSEWKTLICLPLAAAQIRKFG